MPSGSIFLRVFLAGPDSPTIAPSARSRGSPRLPAAQKLPPAGTRPPAVFSGEKMAAGPPWGNPLIGFPHAKTSHWELFAPLPDPKEDLWTRVPANRPERGPNALKGVGGNGSFPARAPKLPFLIRGGILSRRVTAPRKRPRALPAPAKGLSPLETRN